MHLNLLAREDDFSSLFQEQSRLIADASQLLLKEVKSTPAEMKQIAAEVADIEHRGDKVTHDVFIRLNRNSITPIDPEDIHALSSHLDDVLDGIEDAAYRIQAYQIEKIPPPVIAICEIISVCAENIRRALERFGRRQDFSEHCVEINRLENEADLVYRKAIAGLFRPEVDAVALLKMKEVYEFLEATVDRCEDVADVLQTMMVKGD